MQPSSEALHIPNTPFSTILTAQQTINQTVCLRCNESPSRESASTGPSQFGCDTVHESLQFNFCHRCLPKPKAHRNPGWPQRTPTRPQGHITDVVVVIQIKTVSSEMDADQMELSALSCGCYKYKYTWSANRCC